MKNKTIYATLLAGALGLGTLGVFNNGAQALDLSDFTAPDQRVITQEAPAAGGAVLVKEDIITDPLAQPQAQVLIRSQAGVATTAQAPQKQAPQNLAPAARRVTNLTANPAALNAYAPAAGGDGSTGRPGVGIDNKVDVTTIPGNSFDQFATRFNTPGAASAPVDGKPLVTDTLADGRRVEDSFNAITPAAGNASLQAVGHTENAAVKSQNRAAAKVSIQDMTADKESGLFNN